MATRPTPADLTFATDATFAADGDTWSGDATKANPGAPRRAEGYEPDTLPAEWLNWQLNILGQAAEFACTVLDANEEHTYQAAKSRTVTIPLFSGVQRPAPALAAPEWSGVTDPSTGYFWESGAAQVPIVFPLSPFLRTGMVLTSVKVLVDPTAANAGADRMEAKLCYADPNFGTPAAVTPTVVASTADDTTAAAQVITITAGSLAIDRDGSDSKDYYLVVWSANEASGDRIYGVEINYTDPGPRNA